MSKLQLSDFKVVAFDFDGVLADSDGSHTAARLAAYERLAGELGDERLSQIPAWIHEQAHAHGSHPLTINQWILETAGIIKPGDDDRLTLDVVEQKREIYRQQVASGLEALPGAVTFVNRASVVVPGRLAIATTANKNDEVLPFLRRHTLATRFPDYHIAAEGDVVNKKPDPEVYNVLQKRFNISNRPDQMLVIEDSQIGVAAACRAGAVVVGLGLSASGKKLHDANSYGPHYFVHDYHQLEALVGL